MQARESFNEGWQGVGKGLSTDFALYQSYPKPFSPTTVIRYQLPVDSYVTLKVYDVLGRQVRVLVEEVQPAGIHQIVWDGRDQQRLAVTSGVYFYRLMAGSFTSMQKMLLLK